MLGWHINCFPHPEELEWEERQLESGEVYARTPVLAYEARFASWDTGLGGLRWLDELVEQGRAKCLELNGGYPLVYELPLKELDRVLPAPPALRGEVELSECETYPERVLIEAWDQS